MSKTIKTPGDGISTESKTYILAGSKYPAVKTTFALRVWAVKYIARYNNFVRDFTSGVRKKLYDAAMSEPARRELIASGQTERILEGMDGTMTMLADDLAAKTQEAKQEFFLNENNINELLNNYLVDCCIDLNTIEDVNAFAGEVEEVFNDFLLLFGKRVKI